MLDIEFEIRITFEIVEDEDNFEEEVDKYDSVGCDEDVEVSLVEVSAEGKVDDGVDFDDVDVDDEVANADLRFV